MMLLWHALSVVGSLAITGPIGVAIAVWLIAGKSWRMAVVWSLLYGIGMALVVSTKIAFIGWDIGVESVEFTGISGHAMRACAVFPVAFYLAFYSSSHRARVLALAASMVLTLMIAVSRVYTGAHSVSEVITGCMLGYALSAAFIWHARGGNYMVLSRWLAVLCLPVLLVAPTVEPVPTEEWITKAALHLSGHDRAYAPYKWRAKMGRAFLAR
jgi:membrane-associated phospholipid phosphatase